jgi:hypothetical protein
LLFDKIYAAYDLFAMAPVSPDEPAPFAPSRALRRHKASVLCTLLVICDNLRRMQSEAVARRACFEVAELLRDELRLVRRRTRG